MIDHDFDVLVMEPDTARLTTTVEALCHLGFRAKGYRDEAQASRALQATPYDCIFLDVTTIAGNGSARAIIRVARESLLNQTTPVVFLSDMDDAVLMREVFAAGGNFFIVKPTQPAQFDRALIVAELAMMQRKCRASTVPLDAGIACAVADDCFLTQGVMISEAALRVKRHPRLTLGTTVKMSFRLPTGACLHTVGTVSMHDGPLSVLQLDGMTNAERLRVREYIWQRASAPPPETPKLWQRPASAFLQAVRA